MLPCNPLVQFPKGLEEGLRILDQAFLQKIVCFAIITGNLFYFVQLFICNTTPLKE